MQAVLLAVNTPGGWRPGIGDPTVMGWVTVAVYVLAAGLCWRAAGREAPVSGGRFWSRLAGLLAFLGINKQLDLQTLLTVTGRTIASEQGWYGQRREAQAIFSVVLGLLGLAAIAVIALRLRGEGSARRLALAGTAFLVSFILVRAVSFHHVERFLGLTLAGARFNWILELGGICAIILAAASIDAPVGLARRRQA